MRASAASKEALAHKSHPTGMGVWDLIASFKAWTLDLAFRTPEKRHGLEYGLTVTDPPPCVQFGFRCALADLAMVCCGEMSMTLVGLQAACLRLSE